MSSIIEEKYCPAKSQSLYESTYNDCLSDYNDTAYGQQEENTGIDYTDGELPYKNEGKKTISLKGFNLNGIQYDFEENIAVCCTKENNYFICESDNLSSIAGKGTTPFQAYVDWKTNFHNIYQRLRGLRDYELNTEELQLRKAFNYYIPERNYHKSNPIHSVETGRIIDIQADTITVKWVNACKESLKMSLFIKYNDLLKVGVCFEAKTCRSYYEWEMQSIEQLKIIEDLNRDLPQDFFEQFYE